MFDIAHVIVDDAVDRVTGFNQAQVAEERAKAAMLSSSPHVAPTLFELEDHPILRGALAAFELDKETFVRRAAAFKLLFANERHWPVLTAALLATGDYHRDVNQWTFRFGAAANEAPWRDLLTGAGRDDLARTRAVLGQVLDAVAATRSDDAAVAACLEGIETRWRQSIEAEKRLDWRYYLVKYAAMREGRSGIYVSPSKQLGFDLCMLDKTLTNSWYRDPFLLAMLRDSGVGDAVTDPWFTGFGTERWMQLAKSGAGMRIVADGIALRGPGDERDAAAFARVTAELGTDQGGVVRVLQVGNADAIDRVQLGAEIIRALVKAGL